MLETRVNQCFLNTEDSTNLLDFVPFSEEKKGDSSLEVTGFCWSHGGAKAAALCWAAM
jgi:hypothetical protein